MARRVDFNVMVIDIIKIVAILIIGGILLVTLLKLLS